MKTIEWIGNSKKDLKDFPEKERREAGYNLDRVQHGSDPKIWKPMQSLGHGIKEIIIHSHNEYRVIYIAKFPEAIYVLHAFIKKTEKTSEKDKKIIADNYQALIRKRDNHEKNKIKYPCA